MTARWRWIACLLAGVAQTASFAPWSLWWLQPLSIAVLVAALNGAVASTTTRATSLRRAALLGWLFAFGWLLSGWWWLHVSLHTYGGLPLVLSAMAVAALAAAMALYLAAACTAYAAWRSGRTGWDVALFAACWLLAELARGTWFTGFPWIASGYAHTQGPLAALAPWVGSYGIGALSAASAALLVGWLRAATPAPTPADGALSGPPHPAPHHLAPHLPKQPILATAVWLAIVAAAHLGPREFTQATGSLSASLVQPSVPQDLKFDAAQMRRNLDALAEQIVAASASLVVAPESVIPIPLPLLEANDWQRLREPFLASDRGLLLGIFLGNELDGYVNSMVGLSESASPTPERFYAYGKRHLLPFGEFIPPGFGWFVALLNIPLGDQARGTHARPFEVAGQRLRPLICYEDLFAEQLVDSIVSAEPASVFVNASNLAWFGPYLVQDQHLQFSQMRALEFQRPFLRATNTGATAAIDHRGQIVARLAVLERATLDVSIEGRQGTTPFAHWLAAWGLWPLTALGLGVVAAAAGRSHLRLSRG